MEICVIEPKYLNFLRTVKNNLFSSFILPEKEGKICRYVNSGLSDGNFFFLIPLDDSPDKKENSMALPSMCSLRFDKIVPAANIYFLPYEAYEEELDDVSLTNAKEQEFLNDTINTAKIQKKMKWILFNLNKKEESPLSKDFADLKYMVNLATGFSRSEFFYQAEEIRRGFLPIDSLFSKHFFISKNKRFSFVAGIINDKGQIDGYVRDIKNRDLYFEKNIAAVWNFKLLLDKKVIVPGGDDDEMVKDVMKQLQMKNDAKRAIEEENNIKNLLDLFFPFRYGQKDIRLLENLTFDYLSEKYTVLYGKFLKNTNSLNVILRRERDNRILIATNIANSSKYKLVLSKPYDSLNDAKKAMSFSSYKGIENSIGRRR